MAIRAVGNGAQPSLAQPYFGRWAGLVCQTFLAGGWTQTEDTGQGNVNSPLPGNYFIFKANDVLASAAPIYVKVQFTSSGNPGFQVTVGNSTNGSGTIIAPTEWNNVFSVVAAGSSTSLSAVACYGSAGPGRVSIGLFSTTTGTYPCAFSLERTRDSNDNIDNQGIMILSSSPHTLQSPIQRLAILYYPPNAGNSFDVDEIHSVARGVSLGVVTTGSPSRTGYSSTLGVGLFIPVRSTIMIVNNDTVIYTWLPVRPLYGAVVVNKFDWYEGFTQFTMLRGDLGVPINYVRMTSLRVLNTTTVKGLSTDAAVFIRFD